MSKIYNLNGGFNQTILGTIKSVAIEFHQRKLSVVELYTSVCCSVIWNVPSHVVAHKKRLCFIRLPIKHTPFSHVTGNLNGSGLNSNVQFFSLEGKKVSNAYIWLQSYFSELYFLFVLAPIISFPIFNCTSIWSFPSLKLVIILFCFCDLPRLCLELNFTLPEK
jgi:hypothetical protein